MNEYFEELTCFIGSEIADPTGPHAEKPPRSAKHVATLSWSWSPMHSRLSEYRIIFSKKSGFWSLYEVSINDSTNKKISAKIADGKQCKKIDVEKAAYLLLREAWKAEANCWDFDPDGFEVTQSGLLTEEDVANVVQDMAWLSSSDWLSTQDNYSFELLRQQLPDDPDSEIVEVLEEISSCIGDLGLPKDFLQLSTHFSLERPHLLSLLSYLVRDATEVRIKRDELAKQNLEKFRREIELLTGSLDDQPGRGGGMTIPSVRSRARNFLESYVGKHGELPTGKHQTYDMFKTTLDFDALRRKCSI
jgi:hypothetical protein